jgi:hypothetical protein
VIVPRFPRATPAAITNDSVTDPETARRIREACAMTVRLASVRQGA